MASTRVVLPWSTWATIATLRRSLAWSRAGMGRSLSKVAGADAAAHAGGTHQATGGTLRAMSSASVSQPYDEFGLFHENAAEWGLPYDGPPTVRRERVEFAPGRHVSALVWGDAPPELVLLHGGAQNAHTWDTVALALDRPLMAIDLPAHGHSDPHRRAVLAPRLRGRGGDGGAPLAPDAAAVMGMSLGGLTSIALGGPGAGARAHASSSSTCCRRSTRSGRRRSANS